MKLVIQRVTKASVEIEGTFVGAIGKGCLVFLGVGEGDTEQTVQLYADKLLKLRLFADEAGKTNLSIREIGGGLLIVSQFTLYADCRKGNRPSFTKAGKPEDAKRLYEAFISYCKKQIPIVETGEFGAEMQVNLVNDGPFTVILGEELAEKKPNGV